MEKKRVVILACGSFNPPTFGHLRMLEDAKTCLETKGYTVLKGILSPVSDGYGKSTLIGANDRFAMTAAAVMDSDWIRVDGWECSIPEWTTTLNVIRHHQKEISESIGEDVKVLLLVGGDVVETFDKFNSDGSPVWNSQDVDEIVSSGLLVQPRPGSNPEKTIGLMYLENALANVHFIENPIAYNAISSTKIRQAITEHRSIKYLTPDSVINYIKKHSLYR